MLVGGAFTYEQAGFETIPQVHALIARVFDRHVAPLYSQEGLQEFYRYVAPEAMAARLARDHFLLVCKHDEELVGVIEMRDFCHVGLLFVDTTIQGRGIARALLDRAIVACRGARSDLEEITVNASPNSVGIYRKLGFVDTAPEQIARGVRFTPMALKVEGPGRMS